MQKLVSGSGLEGYGKGPDISYRLTRVFNMYVYIRTKKNLKYESINLGIRTSKD